MDSRETLDLSLVIPLFNEAEVFARLLGRLEALVGSLAVKPGIRTEVILVDDGSTDGTAGLIAEVCGRADAAGKYRGIVLSRNFGHQAAITAGMHFARGDAVAVLDGDLQDPPEVVAEFYDKLRGGEAAADGAGRGETRFAFDVVYAVRREREGKMFSSGWRMRDFTG